MADVGTIWVKIGADASELDRVLSGSKAELGKFASDMQAVGMRLAAVGAALTGPLLLGLKGAVDLGDQLDEMSQKTGVSTETLSKFSLAAKNNNIDLNELAQGFKYLAVNMANAQKAGSPQAKIFSDMGVKVAYATGKLRPMEDVLLDIADRFSVMKDGADKVTRSVDIFGRSGMNLIPFLNMSREGLKKTADEAERLSIIMSPENAKAAALLSDSINELQASFKGIFIQLSKSLIPILKSLSGYITDLLSSFGKLLASVPLLGKAFGGITLGLGSLASILGANLILVSQLINSIKIMTAALKISALSIGILTAGITTMGIAAGQFIITYSKMSDLIQKEADESGKKVSGFRKVWESLNTAWTKFATGIDGVKIAQEGLKNKMMEGVPSIRGVAEAFKELAGNLKEGYVNATLAAYSAHTKLLQSMGIFLPAIKTQEEIWADLAAAEDKAKEAAQKYADFLSSIGVSTFANTAAKVRELTEGKAKLTDQFRDGLIPASDYARGLKEIDRQIKSLTETLMTTTIPAARKFSAEIWNAKPALEDAVYSTMTFDESIKAIADSMGYSAATVIRELYNIRAAFLQTLGIILPRWEDIPKAAGQATRETHDYFAGLFSGLARDFGSTLKTWFEGLTTFEEFTKSVWDNIKNAFFTMLGQAATAWITELIDPMISSAKDAGKSVTESMTEAAAGTGEAVAATTAKMGSEFGTLGNIVVQVAKTIGAVITTLVSALAAAVTTIVTTIGAGIVTLATSIATAINVLATAAPALLEIGLVAAAIYTAFKAGEALVGALGSALDTGGDNSDITYWLKPMSERMQEIRDWIFINGQEHLLTIRQILGDISAKTEEVRNSITGGLIGVLNAILGVERDTYKALTASHTIHVVDDALLDAQRNAAASMAGIARMGLPSGLAASTGRTAMDLSGIAESALYKRAHAGGHTFVYAPVIGGVIDGADVARFVRGKMKDEFIKMVRDNAGGITKSMAVETAKYATE